MGYHIGLDLGKSADYSALCVVQMSYTVMGAASDRIPVYHVRALERYPLGTGYDRIADHSARLMRSCEAQPDADGVTLLVDATGVGNAFLDLLRERNVPFVGIGIHGGGKVIRTASGYSVPKVTLVEVLERALEQGALKIAAGLPLGDALHYELQGFRRKQNKRTGNVRFEHGSGEHDDLVLALAIALWGARSPTH